MKNWKTSLTGVIVAIAVAIVPYLQNGYFHWRDLIMPAAIAALGFLTKDYDTTGAGKEARKSSPT